MTPEEINAWTKGIGEVLTVLGTILAAYWAYRAKQGSERAETKIEAHEEAATGRAERTVAALANRSPAAFAAPTRGGAMAREEKYKVWDKKVFGTDPDAAEREITTPEDWRDPDNVLDLRGKRIVQVDPRDPNNIVIQDDRGKHIDLMAWVKEQVGREFATELVARDKQRHNA